MKPPKTHADHGIFGVLFQEIVFGDDLAAIEVMRAGVRIVSRKRPYLRSLFHGSMAYKTAIDQEREGVLDQISAEAQEQDLGYGA
jgi:hypothetical protein